MQSKKLYLALKHEGVNVEINKYDGHLFLNLMLPDQIFRLNIEIDGLQQNYSAFQSLKKLKKNFQSLKNGIYTIQISNILIDENLEEAKAIIINILMLQKIIINSI